MIDEKVKYGDSDIDDYPGKWCLFIMTKDGQSSKSNDKYDHKIDVLEMIALIFLGVNDACYGCGKPIPVNRISLLIPMPVKD